MLTTLTDFLQFQLWKWHAVVETNMNREKANINRENTVNPTAVTTLNYINLLIEQYNLLNELNKMTGVWETDLKYPCQF